MGSSDSGSMSLLLNEPARQAPDMGCAGAVGIHLTAPSGAGTRYSQDYPGIQTPKGYSKAVLRETAPSKVLCVQCHLILRDPVQSQCGHRYCRECYTNQVEKHPGVKCTTCVREGEDDCTLGAFFPDHAIRKDMSSMDAICVNPGCDWIGTFAHFLKHDTECQFQQRRCDCGLMIGCNKMDDHKADECDLRTIKCLHCELSLLAKHKAEHETSCQYYPEICKGCGLRMARSQMAAHVDPIKGDCKNRKCPYGCDVVNTPSHQKDNVVEHLTALLVKFVTLKSNMEQGPVASETNQNNAWIQKVDELEYKVTDIGSQWQSIDSLMRGTEFNHQGEAAARTGNNTSLSVLTEKQSTVENLVAVLNRQLEKVIVEYNGLEHQRSNRLQTEDVATLERKLASLERSLALKEIALAEQDLRIQALEQTSFDGILVWPITDFSRKRQQATSGRTLSIYSPPFFTSRHGYKMCCRLYLNGDGMGKSTHISLFFVVMKGQFDGMLAWPFRQKVTLMLLDQENRDHLIDAFRPDPTSTSFRRPVSDMNIASGCPLFCPLNKLEERRPVFVKDDTIFIKIIVDQGGL